MSTLRLLFENNRVRVSDLRLTKNESIRQTLEYPTVRWQVDDGIQLLLSNAISTDNTASDESKSTSKKVVPDKTVIFDDPKTLLEIENAGDSVFRQLWFELKKEPRRSESETRKILDEAIYTTDVGTDLIFENRYCRAWDFSLAPDGGDPLEPHHHVLDYVFCYVAKGRLLGYSHDGKEGLFDSINEDGDVTWFDLPDGAGQDPSCAHGGKNGYSDIPMREYLVELK